MHPAVAAKSLPGLCQDKTWEFQVLYVAFIGFIYSLIRQTVSKRVNGRSVKISSAWFSPAGYGALDFVHHSASFLFFLKEI